MKINVIVSLVFVASPALADVYRCNVGTKTIYQDVPCPNAKVVDNVNGLPPSRQEQINAFQRASRERALATQLSKVREAEAQAKAEDRRRRALTPQTIAASSPAGPKPNRPDKYYDRPDRYSDRPDKYKFRTETERRVIQEQ